MDFLIWLEDSPIGAWVAISPWGYPIVLATHAVGMAMLVGVALMFSFRALGVATGVPVTSLGVFMRLAQAGFVLNFLSGIALFLGAATEMWPSWPFRIKIILILIGLALTTHLARVCINGAGNVTNSHRTVAAAAVLAWVGALIAGRLIAYI